MNYDIKAPDAVAMDAISQKYKTMAIPLGSLGKLADMMVKCAGIYRSTDFIFDKKAAVIMCADNGVVAQNVTQTGSEVTKIVAENMTEGKATIAVLCKTAGADVFVVDIGMATDSDNTKIINKKIMYGTNDFSQQPAMTRQQVLDAIQVGVDMVKDLKNQGYKLIATGEMGIGNTTTSSAIIAAVLQKEASEVTGRGAGLSSEGLQTKIRVINDAIALHKPICEDMIDVLCKVGGLDIAGLVGVFLGGGIYGVPILVDGLIASTAAMVAVKINALAREYMFATHVSTEPASQMVLQEIDLQPFLHLEMHLGEGTGAVMAFNAFDMANSVLLDMCDFDEIDVEQYQELI